MICGALMLISQRGQLADAPGWLLKLFGRSTAKCGKDVTADTAMGSTGVWACNRIISGTVGQLPLVMYHRGGEPRAKKRATEHPLYSLLHDTPSPEWTSLEFREYLQTQVNFYGNGFAEIERNRAGQVIGLWPLDASKVTKHREGGKVFYRHKDVDEPLPAASVLHVPGLVQGGLMGLSPVYAGRDAIGLDLAMQDFQSQFFRNGAMMSGVVERPAEAPDWGEEARERFRRSIREKHSGTENAHNVLVLEEGMTWKAAGIAPKDAQMLEGRRYSLADLSRLWGVPLPLLSELANAHFNNIESLMTAFYSLSLGNILTRWEQRLSLSLLTPRERELYFFEFSIDGLLRGDAASRATSYSTGLTNGYYTVNEVRGFENLPPVEGGDVPRVQLNTAPLTAIPELTAPGLGGQAGTQQDDNLDAGDVERRAVREANAARLQRRAAGVRSRERVRREWQPVIHEAAQRLVRGELRAVRSILDKHLGSRAQRSEHDAIAALQDYYQGEGFAALFERVIKPALEAYASAMANASADAAGGEAPDIAQFIADYLAAFAARYRGLHEGMANKAVRDGGDALDALLDDWESGAADETAREETIRLGEAVALAVWGALGVQRTVWVASPDACPICQEMDGKTTSIEGAYAASGDVVEGEDRAPLEIKKTFKHPPLHRGCTCSIAPE